MGIASTTLAPSPITMALHVDGYCKYHTGTLTYHYGKVKASCCNATNSSEESLAKTQGCVKGKHHSKHHIEYYYMNYLLYMKKLVSDLS